MVKLIPLIKNDGGNILAGSDGIISGVQRPDKSYGGNKSD
jgi:hypothetical protein